MNSWGTNCFVNRAGAVLDPKDGKPLEPRFLGGKDLVLEKDGEWLTQLSGWLGDSKTLSLPRPR